MDLGFPLPYHEFEFETSRAQGAGGQHVNRTESAVLLRWNIILSTSVPENIKMTLINRLRSQLTAQGELMVRSQEHRSQHQNKDACIEKLLQLLKRALVQPKKRVATQPTRSSQRKRVEAKKIRGEIKSHRQKIRT